MKHVFLTGVPGFIGTPLLETLVAEHPTAHFHLLVENRPAVRRRAEAICRQLPGAHIHLYPGSLVERNFGLSADTVSFLQSTLTEAYHLAALYQLQVRREPAFLVNVEGTRNVLMFLRNCCFLQVFVYVSTVVVSGDRRGVIYEFELQKGQGFHNYYEETKHLAEVQVRHAMGDIPTIIARPGVVIGDSRTGEIARIDGPYFGMLAQKRGLMFGFPGPSLGRIPLVPLDYIVACLARLGVERAAVGKTLHLCAASHLSMREFMVLAARQMNALPPLFVCPKRVFLAFLMDRLQGIFCCPKEVVEYVNHPVVYDTTNTQAILASQGVTSPNVPSYLASLCHYFEANWQRLKGEIAGL